MKIREDVDLKELENYRYKYQENLFFPTYCKWIRQGRAYIKIEIVIKNRQIFINHKEWWNAKYQKYLLELQRAHLLEDF